MTNKTQKSTCKEHNYYPITTKSKIHKTFTVGGALFEKKIMVCDEIENFNLYCCKCGNIIE